MRLRMMIQRIFWSEDGNVRGLQLVWTAGSPAL